MDQKFAQLVDRLHPAFRKLVSRSPVTRGVRPNYGEEGLVFTKGVYLFTDAGKHLYVGRSNRLFDWYENELGLAFKLADEEARIRRATSKSVPGRQLGFDEAWDGAMVQAKARIRAMEYRWVEEADPICQRFLEIYASIALDTKYKDFDTQ